MTTPLPESADGDLHQRTRAAWDSVAHDIHQFTQYLTTHPADAPNTIGLIRQLGALHKRGKVIAVLLARINDTPWSDIAAQLGVDEHTARLLYTDAERRWRDGDPTPWTPVVTGAT